MDAEKVKIIYLCLRDDESGMNAQSGSLAKRNKL